MPESTSPTPLPAPDAGANNPPNLSVMPPLPKRRKPSAFNQGQQRTIQRAKTVIRAAQVPAHLTVLTPHGINVAFITNILAKVTQSETCVTNAITCTDKKEGATLTEQSTKATLMTDLRIGQAAARQAYLHSQPAKVKDYLVGERIDANRATLDQSAITITNKLNADRPAGIDTSFIVKVETDRTAWNAANALQAAELGKGETERELRDALVETIRQLTQQIQFAADAAWPAATAGNGGIRRQFLISTTRPFSA